MDFIIEPVKNSQACGIFPANGGKIKLEVEPLAVYVTGQPEFITFL
ncbi:hypothetical protein [Candidatus Pantoea deserta]|nr:hypothetical protein [Pantoea deserta]